MGNWRTVAIRGKMDAKEALAMIEELSSKLTWSLPASCFHMHHSLCGLDVWVRNDGTIDCVGNLAERDYDLDDIEAGLVYLSSNYPSINLVLHVGDDYEDLTCVATFKVNSGTVSRLPPQIETLPPVKGVEKTWISNPSSVLGAAVK